MPVTPLTIAELNRLARETLEARFPLLWVAGEIANYKCYPSGHCYFTLKDGEAQARAVMFRSRAQSLSFAPRDGQEVEAQVLVTLYEPRGDFQLQVESLRQAGRGRLFEAFLRLKERLAAEGLLAADRKRPLPPLPMRIGIVTSPQAAALRDVLAALRRRAPHLAIVLYPAPVQGADAAAKLVAAIETANARAEVDVLLLVRGGGSIEDLWAFNDEALARAIGQSRLPVVAGIGHETDMTIADLIADCRAATPTTAAELATAGWLQAVHRLDRLAIGLRSALQRRLHGAMQRLDRLATRLVHPSHRLATNRRQLQLLALRLAHAGERQLAEHRRRLEQQAHRLARLRPVADPLRARLASLERWLSVAVVHQLDRRRARLDALGASLTALDPRATVQRGFAIVRDAQGRLVRDAATLAVGAPLTLLLARGEAMVRVESTLGKR